MHAFIRYLSNVNPLSFDASESQRVIAAAQNLSKQEIKHMLYQGKLVETQATLRDVENRLRLQKTQIAKDACQELNILIQKIKEIAEKQSLCSNQVLLDTLFAEQFEDPSWKTASVLNTWKQVFTPEIAALFDTKTVFHLLASDWGKDRKDVDGKSLEGDNFFKMLSYFAAVAARMQIVDPSSVVANETLRIHFNGAQEIAEGIETSPYGAFKDTDQLDQYINAIVYAIAGRCHNLPPKESLFIPIGWGGLPADLQNKKEKHTGHAMMAEVQKQENGLYTFRIFNSGDGLEEFHTKGKFYLDESHYHPLKQWDNVTLYQLYDQRLLFQLLKFNIYPLVIKSHDTAKYTANTIYSAAEIAFGIPGRDNNSLFRSYQAQRSGTCTRQSCDMIALSVYQGQAEKYKNYKIEQKLIALACLLQGLRQGHFPVVEHRDLLEFATKAAGKLTVSIKKKIQKIEWLDEPQMLECKKYIATLVEWQEQMDALQKPLNAGSSVLSADPQLMYFAAIDGFTDHILPLRSSYAFIEKKLLRPPIAVQSSIKVSGAIDFVQLNAQMQDTLQYVQGHIKEYQPHEVQALLHKNIFAALGMPSQKNWQIDASDRAQAENFSGHLRQASELLLLAAIDGQKIHPEIMADLWKAYAITTHLLRQIAMTDLPSDVSFSWVLLEQLLSSNRFAQLPGYAFETLQGVKAYLKSDSPKGDVFAVEEFQSDSSPDYSKFPLFDYSWDSRKHRIEYAEFARLAETKIYDKSIELSAKSVRQPYADIYLPLQQIARIAQMAIFIDITKEDITSFLQETSRNSDLIDLSIEPEFRFIKTWQHRGLSNPFNLTPSSCLTIWNAHATAELEPYVQKYLQSKSTIQEESIAQKEPHSVLSSYDQYQYDTISRGPNILKLDLLLSVMEKESTLLLQEKHRAYFMLHLMASDRLMQTLQAEPLFAKRMSTFALDLLDDSSSLLHSPQHFERAIMAAEILRHLFAAEQQLHISLQEEKIKQVKSSLSHAIGSSSLPLEQQAKISAQLLALETIVPSLHNEPHILKSIQAIFIFQQHHTSDSTQAHIRMVAMQGIDCMQEAIENILQDATQKQQLLQSILPASYMPLELTESKSMRNTIVLKNATMLVQIDFAVGRIYFNGNAIYQNSLPPAISNSPLIPKIMKQAFVLPVRYDAQTHFYHIEHPRWQGISFQNETSVLQIEHDGVLCQYTMISNLLKNQYKYLFHFVNITDVAECTSLWRSMDHTVAQPLLICAHAKDGLPVPMFMLQGCVIHPLTRSDLSLASPYSEKNAELSSFERLGFKQSQLLSWIDKNRQLRRVQIPVGIEEICEQSFISFEKDLFLQKWTLQDTDYTLVLPRPFVKELSHYRHYLVLENSKGQQFILLNLQEIEFLHKRQHAFLPPEIDLMQLLAEGPKDLCRLYPREKGWMSKVPRSDMLYFAYMQLMSANYDSAMTYLKQAVHPLGRPYTFEELQFLRWTIEFTDKKADNHPEAAGVQLYAVHHMEQHLIEYPLPQDIFDALDDRNKNEWKNWVAQSGRSNEWIEEQQKLELQGTRMTLSANTATMSIALVKKEPKQILDNTTIRVPESLAKQIEIWKLPQQCTNMTIEESPLQDALSPFSSLQFIEAENDAREIIQEISKQIVQRSHKAKRLKQQILLLANHSHNADYIKLTHALDKMHFVSLKKMQEIRDLFLLGRQHYHAQEESKLWTLVQEYLFERTEVQHMRRIEDLLKKYCNTTDATKKEKACTAAQGLLQQQRAYSIHQDSGINSDLLAFEELSNIRLRVEQTNLLQELTLATAPFKRTGEVRQLVMGAGKTKIIAPLLMWRAAKAGNIPLFCIPNALYGTGTKDFAKQMQRYLNFLLRVETLEFSRNSCSKERLLILAEKLQRAQQECVVLSTRPKDLHALKLMFRERHELLFQLDEDFKKVLNQWQNNNQTRMTSEQRIAFLCAVLQSDETKIGKLSIYQQNEVTIWQHKYARVKEEAKIYEEELELLLPIIQALKHHAMTLFDEFDSTFDPRNQLSFPVGKSMEVSATGIATACELYFKWLPQFEADLHIDQNQQTLLPLEQRQQIIESLAQKIVESMPQTQGLDGHALQKYLLGETDTSAKQVHTCLQAWNSSEDIDKKQAAERWAFIKYALTSGLQGAWEAAGHASYGRAQTEQEKNLGIVIPYENGHSKENTRFRGPWESAFKTCQYYRHSGLDSRQLHDAVQQRRIGAEQQRNPLLLQDLSILFPPELLENIQEEKNLQICVDLLKEALHEADSTNDKKQSALRFVGNYLQQQVLPKDLKIDAVQISSTPQDLGGISHQSQGFSGTWSYSHTWPLHIAAKANDSTDGQTIEALKKNGSCLFVQSLTPFAVLDELLLLQNAKESSHFFDSVIDVGALFKGIPNDTVAQYLLQKCNKKAVLYYHAVGNGETKLAVLKELQPIFIEGSDLDSIKKAIGTEIDLEREVVRYYDLAHTIGADIWNPEQGQACVLMGDQVTKDKLLQAVMRMRGLKNSQTVQFIVMPPIKNLILEATGRETIDSEAIIAYASLYQQNKEKYANFHGICEQIKYHIRDCAEEQMQQLPVKEQQEIYKKLRPLLVGVQTNDLFQQFGGIEENIDPFVALYEFVDTLPLYLLSPDRRSRSEEIIDLLHSIIEKYRNSAIPLPQNVRQGMQQLEATVEVELSQNKQQEVQQEIMTQKKIPLGEFRWKVISDTASLLEATEMGFPGKNGPGFYRLNDVLKTKGVASFFDSQILISQNMLNTFTGRPLNQEILTNEAKPLHHLLIVPLSDNEARVIIVTLEEARVLKQDITDQHNLTLVETNGALVKSGKKIWSHPFHSSGARNVALQHKLIQTMLYQGDMKLLLQDPWLSALKNWLVHCADKQAARLLLEQAVKNRAEDLKLYMEASSFRALFS